MSAQSHSDVDIAAEVTENTRHRPGVMVLSPSLSAVSGVSTHTNLLFDSTLAEDFRFVHFKAGSEGGKETLLPRVLRLLLSPWQLARAILAAKPAIVHINTAMDPKAYWRDIWYVAVARLLRRRVILQIHGGSLPAEFFGGNVLLNGLLRRVLEATDVVVLISKLERDAYSRFAPRARTELIPNAIPIEGLIDADSNKALRNGPLRLAYLGRWVASKGVLELVEALKLLRERGVDARLSLAGSGPLADHLRTAVNEAQIANRVEFCGVLFGERKNALWRDTDAFVFPTYHKEGLPYSLLEAMAAGAVPIISPVGGIPDVMQDGVHGLFVPSQNPAALADIIERLDADRQAVVRMATAARARVCESYTIVRLAADFRRLYRTLLQSR